MKELKFLMWNLRNRGKKYINAFDELYREQKPDFLLLIESDIEDKHIEELSKGLLKSVMLNKKKTIRLYVNPKYNVQLINEEEAKDGRFSQIKERLVFFKCDIDGLKILLVGVHFPSKFNNSPNTQFNIMKRWLDWIKAQEMIIKTENTIIWGDLNLNPFDLAIYRDGGLNAHPSIKHKPKVKPLYYNPMWSTLGDFIYKTNKEKVPGTFFYDLPIDNHDDFHWNSIDGVLIKKDFAEHFSKKDLEIIVKTKSHLFSDLYGIDSVKYSDHLPLKFKLLL